MKEIFCKNQKFFCGFSQKNQGKQGQTAEPEQERDQNAGAEQAQGPQGQQVQGGPQGQDQGHEQAQTAVSHGDAQEKKQRRGQKTEEQVYRETELIQPQLPPQGGQQVVHQAQGGAAGQGDQGLQPLVSGVQAHQPSSLPNQPRRPGAFSA